MSVSRRLDCNITVNEKVPSPASVKEPEGCTAPYSSTTEYVSDAGSIPESPASVIVPLITSPTSLPFGGQRVALEADADVTGGSLTSIAADGMPFAITTR